MDAFWSGDQQGGFSEGLLLRSSGRLIKGWVWGVHPQLRNGLAVSPLNPSLFYLNQQTELVTLNIATGQRTLVWPKETPEVNTEITCFSIIDKYVVIGTDDGQLVVLDIAKGHQKLLSRALAPHSSMVNAIVGYRHGDERRIVVCSNNHSVRVFKFPEMTSASVIDLQRTSNFAALSPDHQWMVVVGDRTELYVLKAGENEFHLKHIVPLIGEELQDGNGGNMVSWEPHPPYRFAVASEAGATLVFAHPGDEDWSSKPLCYLWSHNVDPWTHAASYPIPALPASPHNLWYHTDVGWSDKQALASDAKMASVKFVTTSSATEQGSSLLIACSAGQHIYVYDLERRLRQSIDIGSLPCVATRASLSGSASASASPVDSSPTLASSLSGDDEEESEGVSDGEGEGEGEGGEEDGEELLAALHADGGADAREMGESEEDVQSLEISGIVASADGSKIYVSFESNLDVSEGFIVELVVNKLASLRSQCTRFVQQNMNQWRGFDWERHLPATLLSEIFSPYKFS